MQAKKEGGCSELALLSQKIPINMHLHCQKCWFLVFFSSKNKKKHRVAGLPSSVLFLENQNF
jgi:hypothetical protein